MSVFTWGLGISGQLGSDDKKTSPIPKSVKFYEKQRHCCKQVSCGGLFTSVLTSDGQVLTTGCGKNGRLGNNQTENNLKFKPVLALGRNHKQVSSGIWHGAAISKDDDLYIWGHSKACGNEGENKLNFIPPSILPAIKVIGVSCGFNYTLAWSVDGQAYSFGSGHFGVLGHGSLEDVSSPKQIKALNSLKVICMSAGYNHSGTITDDGRLFMFGKGSDGALGLGEAVVKPQSEPREVISSDVCFKSVSCSVGEHHGHTLAVTADGHVYSWGDGYKGKLGHGDQNSAFEPIRIDPQCFGNESIIQVSAGGIHSCALNTKGRVYTWGCGSDGRLGHPESIGHRYLYRCDTPKQVEELNKYKVTQLSSSYYHCAALVEK